MPSLRFRYSPQILWALAVVGALVQGSVLGASQWAVHSVMTGLPARGELKGLEQTAQATVIYDASDKPGLHDLPGTAARRAARRRCRRT